ncbi:Protein of unknown function [Rhizobium sp. NFR07]|nr:Protein of unknown function [Rhizobium sp. NFR07]
MIGLYTTRGETAQTIAIKSGSGRQRFTTDHPSRRDGALVSPCRSQLFFLLAMPLLTACTSVPLKEGGTLSSYSRLSFEKGTLSKRRTYVDSVALSPLRTATIIPASFTHDAASRVESLDDRRMVANILDRALCISLSDRFDMVPYGQASDLSVRAVVTDIVPTDTIAAGASAALTLGTGFALPIAAPRLPIGLGGIAVEAEAVDHSGNQVAATVWARGANSISNTPRVSQVGDAYALAATFGNEFSKLIVDGQDGNGPGLSLPSAHRVQSWFGGTPKHAACDTFGRSPGLVGLIASRFGAPPKWTDNQAQPSASK